MSTIERLVKKAEQLERCGSGIRPGFGVLIPIATGRTTLLGTAPTTHLATRNGFINPLSYKESRKAHYYNNNYISSHLCHLRQNCLLQLDINNMPLIPCQPYLSNFGWEILFLWLGSPSLVLKKKPRRAFLFE